MILVVTFFQEFFFLYFCRWLSMHGHGQQYFIQRTQFLLRYVIDPVKQNFERKIVTETVLLSTHNVCVG